MLYSEFLNRTHVEVTAAEYEVIENMYYASTDDKDTFCAKWCRLNADRVKAAKAAEKARAEKARKIEKFYAIMDRIEARDPFTRMNTAAVEILTATQLAYLKAEGITLEVETMDYNTGNLYPFKLRASDIAFECRKRVQKLIKAA